MGLETLKGRRDRCKLKWRYESFCEEIELLVGVGDPGTRLLLGLGRVLVV